MLNTIDMTRWPLKIFNEIGPLSHKANIANNRVSNMVQRNLNID